MYILVFLLFGGVGCNKGPEKRDFQEFSRRQGFSECIFDPSSGNSVTQSRTANITGWSHRYWVNTRSTKAFCTECILDFPQFNLLSIYMCFSFYKFSCSVFLKKHTVSHCVRSNKYSFVYQQLSYLLIQFLYFIFMRLYGKIFPMSVITF